MHVNNALGSLKSETSYNLGLGVIDWGKLLETGVESAAAIFKSRFGQPPLGTSIFRRNPQTGEVEQVVRSPMLAAGVLPTATDTGSTMLLLVGMFMIFLLVTSAGEHRIVEVRR